MLDSYYHKHPFNVLSVGYWNYKALKTFSVNLIQLFAPLA